MITPADYDEDPERYRTGMRTAAYASADLYQRVAGLLTELGAGTVLDVGCASGVLRAALPTSGPRLVGLDRSATLLATHPAPAVRADATALPFAAGVFDAVTALNTLDHLPEPLDGIREARRVLRPGGHLVAAAIGRGGSAELAPYWTPAATPFDAEDAPALLSRVFDEVTVYRWDAPLVTLPHPDAIRQYLVGRQAPPDVAEAAAAGLTTPLRVTKRGALLVAASGGR